MLLPAPPWRGTTSTTLDAGASSLVPQQCPLALLLPTASWSRRLVYPYAEVVAYYVVYNGGSPARDKITERGSFFVFRGRRVTTGTGTGIVLPVSLHRARVPVGDRSPVSAMAQGQRSSSLTLDLNATQCNIAHLPEPTEKKRRPFSATVQPPRVYEPKVSSPLTPKVAVARPVPAPSPTKEPLLPPRVYEPRKEMYSPPRVYEPSKREQRAFAMLQSAAVRATWSTIKHEFVPSEAVMSRNQRELLKMFEETQRFRAAVEQERWRVISAAQREGRAPRVYEPPAPSAASSRPSTAGGSRPSTAGSRPPTASLSRGGRQDAIPGIAPAQPSVFSFGFLGVPERRQPRWDARVDRTAGGSLPVPSDSLMRHPMSGAGRPSIVPSFATVR